MRILITGAAGFVGQALTTALLNDDEGRHHVVLTDVVNPSTPPNVKWPQNATPIKADLVTDALKVIDKDLDAVFILHGIMSSGAEADFELGMKVNFDATRSLIDALRTTNPGIKVIYTSGGAVYGGVLLEPVDETMRPTPQSSYGCEKMMCEYLINEYTRRGFLNGFIFRLPTVSVRPGKPTAAASSFLSGMIREPMQGLPCVIPLRDRAFKHWITSPKVLVENLMYSLSLPRDALPSHDRVVLMPGLGVSVQEMMDSLARIGGRDKLQYLSEEDDEVMKAILYSWPTTYDNKKALDLGFKRDLSFDDIVRQFQEGLEM